MSTDDRMVNERPTPIRSIHGRLHEPTFTGEVQILRPPPYRPRTPEQQLAALHGEVDDLHERDMRINAQVTLLRFAVLGLVWHALGFWPASALWGWWSG